MIEQLAVAPGVELGVERFGRSGDPCVVLIGGLGASMDFWDPVFCERLADAGRLVIRYDHRDTGTSTTSPPEEPSYTGEELATDPLRILDVLGIERAHLVGVSMGGGIAQQLGAVHPSRVASLTLIATSPAGERTDRRELPKMEAKVATTFEHPAPEPAWDDRSAVIDYLVDSHRPYAGTLGFDEQRTRAEVTSAVDRSRDIHAASVNHPLAPDGGTTFRMADIRVPTLVMHGTADPMFPPAHGEALARDIDGAMFVPLAGMGHEVPPPELWDQVLAAIIGNTAAPTGFV